MDLMFLIDASIYLHQQINDIPQKERAEVLKGNREEMRNTIND
jgi:hypothetical protein